MPIPVQDTYPADFAHCFGCGRFNESGHQLKTSATDDGTLTEFSPRDYYRGAGEFAYGGLIASVIDCHSAGSAAIFWITQRGGDVGQEESPRFVTARLEVDYVAPTPLLPFRLTGSAVEVGHRKVIVATDLRAGPEVTARGRAVLVRVTS